MIKIYVHTERGELEVSDINEYRQDKASVTVENEYTCWVKLADLYIAAAPYIRG